MELTEQERSQIYLELSKHAITDYLRWRNHVWPTASEVLTEWNRRFERTVAAHGFAGARPDAK